MTTPARDEAVPTGWRYSINYGPDGEENFANVYAADGQFVGNLRTHHAIAICNAFAVCEKLASAPAPASGRVDAVAVKRELLLERAEDFDEASKKFERLEKCVLRTRAQECRDLAASLSPASPPAEALPSQTSGAVTLTRQQIDGLLRAAYPLATASERDGALASALAKPSSPAGGDVVETLDEADPSGRIAAAIERAAQEGYRVCAETRHVTLGDKVRSAILALSQSTSAGMVGE